MNSSLTIKRPDIAGVPGIGGQLRVTAIRPNATVPIQCIPLSEYLTGDWFPGLAYQGRYPDLGALVTELERWLGRFPPRLSLAVSSR